MGAAAWSASTRPWRAWGPASPWPSTTPPPPTSTPPPPRRIISTLMADGRVRRAWLGVAVGPRPLPPRVAGRLGRRNAVEVIEVVDGSPAALAGLRPEDLLVELDGIR